jgi:hypothetical protein
VHREPRCAVNNDIRHVACVFSSIQAEFEFGYMQVSIANESDQVNEGHSVDALAVRGYEGRGTLR